MHTELLLDRNEKKIIASTWQDVEPIIERNKRLQSTEQRSDWGRHIMCAPAIFVQKKLDEEYARGNTHLRYLGPGFDEWFTRTFINDPEYRDFRVDNPSNPFYTGWRA